MKLTSIPKISKYRIFRNFSWTTSLSEFGRYNLIFAANGSGKTTLSHLFRFIELKKQFPPADGEAIFAFGGVDVNGNQFETHPLPNVRVFNRDSVKRSVFEEVSGELPPVFYLGEDSVEKQKQIAQLRGEAAILSEKMVKSRMAVDSADSGLDTFCINSARAIKNLLTASGSSYNTYDKASFRQTVEKIQKGNMSRELLDKVSRTSLIQLKASAAKSLVASLSETIPNYGSLRQQASSLLEATVVSQLIADLVADPAVASWVGQGLSLHHDSNKCKFCDQPLPSHRLEQLAAHFNDQFRAFQVSLDAFLNDIEEAKSLLSKNMPSRAEFYDDMAAAYEESAQNLGAVLEESKAILAALQKAIRIKKEKPFEALPLKSLLIEDSQGTITDQAAEEFLCADDQGLVGRFGGAALASCNSIIKKHNNRVSNHNNEVGNARRDLERHEVAVVVEDYISKKERITEANTQLSGLLRTAREVQEQISQLEGAIRTHQRPAEELTKELAAYLGNSELTFEVKDSGYLIKRSGLPATNLSEGERTAIAFLHFLKSLSDTSFDLKNGIVVIDDPVSSLDANSLYCAFGYMKEKTTAAKQLFILTHNFTLFRLVRNWFKHIKPKKQTCFYMIATDYGSEGRSARIAALDPLLHEYESEYQYLFKCVIDTSATTVGKVDLASYYGAVNIARRVLETFLAFKLPHISDNLHAKLEAITFDSAKKARILRFLDVGSHADQIDEPEHDISILSETPAVLRDLLELIKSVDKQHYDGMRTKLATPRAVLEMV